jgi:diguanylate cyclase (GGDEF)-like protein
MAASINPQLLQTADIRAALPPHAALIVDASTDPAVIVDRELRLIYYNHSFTKLSELPVRELRKRGWQAMCHAHFRLESCAREGCIALRAFELRRSIRVDEVESARDNKKFIITAIPLIDQDGSLSYVIEKYRDVTAEHRMQENYKKLLEREVERNKILQKEVERRTEELSRANSALKQALEQVSILARTDALTGLFNRRYFDEQFELEMRRAERFNRPLSLVVLDLDRFKEVNDRHGHSTGDDVLRRFAELALRENRSTDVLARIGGEEFGLLLLGTCAEEAMIVAERLRSAQEREGLLTTVSAGIAGVSRTRTTQAELFEEADRALYRAKQNGRNRIERSDQ